MSKKASGEVSVLGPAGTFTDKAARRLYPGAKLCYMGDVLEVFEAAAAGGLGVVALENNLEGSVAATMQGLLEYDVSIVAETVLDIELCLLAPSGVKAADIKEVRSHSHALAQCRDYLRTVLSDTKAVPTSSTVSAMEEVAQRSDAAAIGFRESGIERGLSILAEGIQDLSSQTRFIAISDEGVLGERSSIIFAVKDEPGALYSIIKVFADANINLTKIESRPLRRDLGEYVFFVDFENGVLDAERKNRLLSMVRERTTLFKDLGSY